MSGLGRIEPIVASVRRRLQARKALLPLASLQPRLPADPGRGRAFTGALRAPGLSVVAEHKRRSPSRGALGRRPLADVIHDYARGGAAAYSVLTERDHFDGALADLSLAALLRPRRPCLRKDFVLDDYMVIEAAAFGASAILLLCCLHEGPVLRDLCRVARQVGLASLIEVRDRRELDLALSCAPDAVGVNARDLRTFAIDRRCALELLQEIPKDLVRIAESGIHTPADAREARQAGADAILVGTSLMKAEDPATLLEELRGA